MCTFFCGTDSRASHPAKRSRAKVLAAIAAASLLLAAAGCGSGEYHKRMKDRLSELQGESKYLELLDIDEIDVSDPQARSLGVILKPPKDIVSQGKPLRVGYVEDNIEVDERRVKPPFLLDLRDFCLSYELLVPNPNTRRRSQAEVPIYCYFAVSPADSIEQQELLDEIRQPLVEKFGRVPDEWEDLTLPATGGRPWKRLQVQGEQFFDCVPEPAMLDGRFDVYVHSDQNYHVVVAWRAPTDVDDKVELMRAGEVSLETLRIEPPAVPLEGTEPSDDSDPAD
jgi:hypothetical protein